MSGRRAQRQVPSDNKLSVLPLSLSLTFLSFPPTISSRFVSPESPVMTTNPEDSAAEDDPSHCFVCGKVAYGGDPTFLLCCLVDTDGDYCCEEGAHKRCVHMTGIKPDVKWHCWQHKFQHVTADHGTRYSHSAGGFCTAVCVSVRCNSENASLHIPLGYEFNKSLKVGRCKL
jgi:hypothetical protein